MTSRARIHVSAVVALMGLACAAGVRAVAEELTLVGVGTEETITCDERDVVVTGADQHLTLRGRCAQVSVHGAGHVIHVERLGRAQIDGLNNRLEWEFALSGDRPDIKLAGVNNKSVRVGSGPATSAAARGSQASVVVEGADGRVVVGAGGVRIESPSKRGSDGTVTVSADGVTVGVGGTGGNAGAQTALRIKTSEADETHDCAGGSVTVEGSDDRLTLTHCSELIVTGSGNHIVMLGPVRHIGLLGGENQVQWSEGVGGRAPKVELLGGDNQVTRK